MIILRKMLTGSKTRAIIQKTYFPPAKLRLSLTTRRFFVAKKMVTQDLHERLIQQMERVTLSPRERLALLIVAEGHSLSDWARRSGFNPESMEDALCRARRKFASLPA